jgi:hypothetical protein
VLAELRKKGVVVLGKTGTHFDSGKGRPTITDSMMIAAVGRGEKSSSLSEGFVIVIYIADTRQHHATEVFYDLLPYLTRHPRYASWGVELN